MKWRKLNRALHRDLGYLFFGLTIIYALSGIALNHLKDWNPNYIIKTRDIKMKSVELSSDPQKEEILSWMEKYAEGEKYKNHYFPQENQLKVFIDDGSILIDTQSGKATIETSKRRPFFHEFNYLHYNPKKLWTWISDIYAVSLILLALTGLFILRGKQGIKGRGAWLTTIGILIPLIFLLFYYYKIF